MTKVVHTYRPYGAARDLFLCRDPEVLIEGPAGTGKTRAVLEYVNYLCENNDNIRVLMFRKTRASMTESVLVTYEDEVLWPGHPARTGEASRGNRMSYTYPNGSHVVVGGMDNSDRIMSTQYDLICGFEATELSQEDWEKVTTRNRNLKLEYQQCIADCNPGSQYHWLNRRANKGSMTRLLSRHEDNPVYYTHETKSWTPAGQIYLQKLDRLSGARRERLLLGLWVSEEGMIYDKWDPRIHVVGKTALEDERGNPRCKDYFGSIDWGYRAPGVFQVWGVDEEKTMYRVAEVYQPEKVFDWWADQIASLVKEFGVYAIAADPAEPRSIEMLNDRLGSPGGRSGARIVRKADNDWMAGRDMVDWCLQDDEGHPRMYFVENALRCGRNRDLDEKGQPCSTIEEFPGYVWLKSEDGRPIKEQPDPSVPDHGLDAARYAAMFNWRRHGKARGATFKTYSPGSIGDVLDHQGQWEAIKLGITYEEYRASYA
jgi:phage terminase large subunit